MEELLIIPFIKNNGYFQMAMDEFMLDYVSRNRNKILLRFYEFSPACISLGYFQKISTINIEEVKKNNIDLLRRKTGGRGVLHKNELTYSIAAGNDTELFKSGLKSSMMTISSVFIEIFKNYEMNIELESGKKSGRSGIGACFDSPSLYELKYDGKKLIGSAQKRIEGGFLQHGAIPWSYNMKLNQDLLNAPEFDHVMNAEFLENDKTRNEFIEKFYNSFKDKLDLSVYKTLDIINENEIELIEEKYRDREFIFKR